MDSGLEPDFNELNIYLPSFSLLSAYLCWVASGWVCRHLPRTCPHTCHRREGEGGGGGWVSERERERERSLLLHTGYVHVVFSCNTNLWWFATTLRKCLGHTYIMHQRSGDDDVKCVWWYDLCVMMWHVWWWCEMCAMMWHVCDDMKCVWWCKMCVMMWHVCDDVMMWHERDDVTCVWWCDTCVMMWHVCDDVWCDMCVTSHHASEKLRDRELEE
jgi:hypothetical protein